MAIYEKKLDEIEKGMIYQGSKDMHIDIATEQEKITKQEMINKTCEWLLLLQ